MALHSYLVYPFPKYLLVIEDCLGPVTFLATLNDEKKSLFSHRPLLILAAFYCTFVNVSLSLVWQTHIHMSFAHRTQLA